MASRMDDQWPDLPDRTDPDVYRLMTVSGRTLAPVSEGLQLAGDTLLRKALRALHSGDEESARRYAQVAVALPFDEHEAVHPAWWAAHMLMIGRIVDRFLGNPEGDLSWLAAAEGMADECDPGVQAVLRAGVAVVHQDYVLTPTVERQCRRFIGSNHPDDWIDGDPGTPDARLAAILAVVRAVVAYQRAE